MNLAMPYQLALSNDAVAPPDVRVKPLKSVNSKGGQI